MVDREIIVTLKEEWTRLQFPLASKSCEVQRSKESLNQVQDELEAILARVTAIEKFLEGIGEPIAGPPSAEEEVRPRLVITGDAPPTNRRAP